jgi:AcrR family transcriptional regulator
MSASPVPSPPRNAPAQARSRERLALVLSAADKVLAGLGADAFTTTRIAQTAKLPIGAVYRFFPDKQAIAQALALRYWSDFENAVADVAGADAREPLADPTGAVLSTLADCFRSNPGFMALWFGGLRSEAIRDATRPAREAIAGSIERILAAHWPHASAADRARVAAMVVLAGDGLLREAFRREPQGDGNILGEARLMLDSYIAAALTR